MTKRTPKKARRKNAANAREELAKQVKARFIYPFSPQRAYRRKQEKHMADPSTKKYEFCFKSIAACRGGNKLLVDSKKKLGKRNPKCKKDYNYNTTTPKQTSSIFDFLPIIQLWSNQ